MMKKIQPIIFVIASMLLSVSAKAQRVFELMQQEHVTLKEVQEEAAAYFSTVGTLGDSSYDFYKQWEYQALAKLGADGTLQASTPLPTPSTSAINAKNFSPSNWTAIGSNSTTTTGEGFLPGAGRITAIYVEPVGQQLIYVGAPGGGLWKSTNGGSSWVPLGDQFENMYIFSIEVDPNNSDIVYIGNSQGQLLKSTDGGLSFGLLLDRSGILSDILIHPNDSNYLYAALKTDGLYYSINGGENWTTAIDAGIEDIAFKPGSTSTLYACGDDFYRSTNSGVSFSKVTNGIAASNRMKLAVSPADRNYVYLIQKGVSGFGYLYRSEDSGVSFGTQSVRSITDFVGANAFRDMVIAVSSSDIDEIHIGGFELYKSTNGGISFAQETLGYVSNVLPFVHIDINVMHAINGTLYVGSSGGIYRSTDNGVSYTDLSAGLGIQQCYRTANAASNSNMVVVGAQNIGSSIVTKNTQQWRNFLSGNGTECMIDPDDATIIYASSQNGILTTSMNSGEDIHYLRPPENGQGVWVTPFGMDPNNGRRIYAGYSDLYRHENRGLTADGEISDPEDWINVSSGITFDSKLYHLEPCPSDNSVIYVSTLSSLYKGTDLFSETPTWTTITPMDTAGMFINDIAVDPYDRDRIAIATASGFVVLSIDGGTTWNRIDEGLPNAAIKSILFDRAPSQGLYVAIDGMVFYKNNTLSTWTAYSNNLPKVALSELEIYYDKDNPEAHKIRLATYGRGLWESPLYDDSVMPVNSCAGGILDPYSTIEAEDYCDQLGVQKVIEVVPAVGYINHGDYIKFEDVAFGGNGTEIFNANVASDRLGGNIEIRLNAPTGPLAGTCSVGNTGGWASWVSMSFDIDRITGTHDVYFVFTGDTGALINIDSFSFSAVDICVLGSNAFSVIEAEDFCEQSGVEIIPDGQSVGFIENGDYIKFNQVSFSSGGATLFSARVASAKAGGDIEIYLDDPDGTLLGTFAIETTGSWTTWTDVSFEVDEVSGTHDLYLVFTGGSGYLFNIDWFQFVDPSANTGLSTPTLSDEDQVLLYPNPARDTIYLELPNSGEKTEIHIANILGQILKKETLSASQNTAVSEINIAQLPPGLYSLIIVQGKTTLVKNMLVK